MKLPAHYTVKEVIDALEVALDRQDKRNIKFNIEYEDFLKGKMVNALPFGLFGWKVISVPDVSDRILFCDLFSRNHPIKFTSAQLTALRKLPLDAKVKLSVEEINELFNNETKDAT